MEEKISNILDLFPALTIQEVENILKDNNNNVETSIEYLLNNNINETLNNNLNNCGKGFGNSNNSNDKNEFKTQEEEENERLFQEFMKKENIENEIINKSKTHYCEICFMDLPIEDFYILDECEHRFCTDCLSTHFTIQIKAGYSFLKCPSVKCIYVASYDEAKHLLNKETFERYDRLLLNQHLQKDKNVYTCPQGDCGFKMVAYVNKNHSNGGNYLKCANEDCGSSFCVDCREEAHHELSCGDFANLKRELAGYLTEDEEARALRTEYLNQQRYGRLNRESMAQINKRLYFAGKKVKDLNIFNNFLNEVKKNSVQNYRYLTVYCKMCPTCYSLIEKSIGCNDMKCICNTHFCFGCGVRSDVHDQSTYPCANIY